MGLGYSARKLQAHSLGAAEIFSVALNSNGNSDSWLKASGVEHKVGAWGPRAKHRWPTEFVLSELYGLTQGKVSGSGLTI